MENRVALKGRTISLFSNPNAQSGFSLIELLVSMLIASIIFGGVIAVVQTSRTSHVSEQESAFMQESTRFAIELLSRDIRMAGALGCAASEFAKIANVLGSVDTTAAANLGGLIDNSEVIGLIGFDGSNASTFPAAIIQTVSLATPSDAIILRYADPDPRRVVEVESHSGLVIRTVGSHSYALGDKIAIVNSGCQQAGIFQNTGASSDSLVHQGGGVFPGNCDEQIFSTTSFNCQSRQNKSSNRRYEPGSMIYPYVAHAYYVDESSLLPGVPALKRTVMNSTGARPEELAQGVENLNFLYGVDTLGEGVVNNYVTAANVDDWGQVLSVKFSITLRSQREVLAEPKSITLDGNNFNDRYMRQLVSGTVALRNKK